MNSNLFRKVCNEFSELIYHVEKINLQLTKEKRWKWIYPKREIVALWREQRNLEKCLRIIHTYVYTKSNSFFVEIVCRLYQTMETLRFKGTDRWNRGAKGIWRLDKIVIQLISKIFSKCESFEIIYSFLHVHYTWIFIGESMIDFSGVFSTFFRDCLNSGECIGNCLLCYRIFGS